MMQKNNNNHSGLSVFTRNSATIFTLLLAVVIPCLGKALLVTSKERTYESSIVSWFHKSVPSVILSISKILALVFSTKGCIAILVLLAALSLFINKNWKMTIIQLLISLLPMIYIFAVKFAVNRPRPYIGLNIKLPTDPSFPSGHTSAAVAVCVMAMLILYINKPSSIQFGLLFSAILVVIVAVSRIIVAAHFPTDVLAAAIIYPLLSVTILRSFQRHNLYIDNRNNDKSTYEEQILDFNSQSNIQ
ncbi:phosphatase PAP2 family protein [Gardnerella swidsinskii]|uniref:phosphatase PAP2 family protein n=1 Tax=Gardnerella swidsinskii TaxID=2792979 RepID=UPI000C9A0849|nr:phosphoesterase [Gardnerella vaginalis]